MLYFTHSLNRVSAFLCIGLYGEMLLYKSFRIQILYISSQNLFCTDFFREDN